MIPLHDEGIRRRSFPYVTVAIIVINVLVFIYEITLSGRALDRLIFAYGVIPLEITAGQQLSVQGIGPEWGTLFTSMFMHGGWMHLIGNMLYLWVFGDNIEDTYGHFPFLVFYLFAGLLASGAQIFTDPSSRVPAIGASGAVAGVLGAYLVLYPKARINTLIFLFYFIRTVRLPAVLVLGFWGVTQLFSGIGSLGAQGGVAYWAHVGGFAVGLVVATPVWLQRRGRPRSEYYDDDD